MARLRETCTSAGFATTTTSSSGHRVLAHLFIPCKQRTHRVRHLRAEAAKHGFADPDGRVQEAQRQVHLAENKRQKEKADLKSSTEKNKDKKKKKKSKKDKKKK